MAIVEAMVDGALADRRSMKSEGWALGEEGRRGPCQGQCRLSKAATQSTQAAVEGLKPRLAWGLRMQLALGLRG